MAQKHLVRIALLKLQEIKGRVDTEVAQAKNKKNVAELFVRLLEEWQEKLGLQDDTHESDESFTALQAKTFPDLVQLKKKTLTELTLISKPNPVADLSIVDEVFHGVEFEKLQKTVSIFCKRTIKADVSSEEVVRALDKFIKEKGVLCTMNKARARQILDDEELVAEYASLLTILMKHLDTWNWTKPLDMRLHFFSLQRKFRGIMQEEIDDALLLQVIGHRFSKMLKPALLEYFRSMPRLSLLQKVAPRIEGPSELSTYNLWLNGLIMNESIFMSVLNDRSEDTKSDDVSDSLDAYVGGGKQILALAKSIQYFKQHAENIGGFDNLTVVQTDVKNLCYSFSHELLLKLMRTLGFDDFWCKFIMRAHAPTVNIPSEEAGETVAVKVRRGLLMAHEFAKIFGELALFVIEYIVLKKSNVPLIRNHDDILFWHHDKKKARQVWAIIYDSLARMGLEPNLQHSGHINIPLSAGELLLEKREKLQKKGICPDAIRNFETWLDKKIRTENDEYNKPETNLPKGSVAWRLLKLDLNGEWILDQDYHQYLQKCWLARYNQEQSTISVLQMINFYNNHGRRITWLLESASSSMGDSHIHLIVTVLSKLHSNPIDGLNKSIPEIIKDLLLKHFPKESSKIIEDDALLDGWLYWPIRAGGLGLQNFAVKAQQIKAGFVTPRNFTFRDLDKIPKNYFEYLQTMYITQVENGGSENSTDLPPNWRKVKIPVDSFRGRKKAEYTDGYVNIESLKIQFERPKWRGNFDYESCKDFSSMWNRFTTGNYSYFGDWMEVTQEKGPIRDSELKDMIAKFCARRENWVGALADRKSTNLGPYFSEIVQLYGPSLRETFGGFGIIPADLVPHALVKQVGLSFQPQSVEDDEDWVDL